ncbi:DUF4397 domain-containing protein [Hymenobacter sp. BT664]|uniref:DUF4397 domain-containing protein n=1 Tax=Hymenobacter montanus TaxID=2771359 RepID=A0A927BBB5_9BACT|nr:DUF4397 domain-containing protein [Hymenobacter montanus]MBD2766967.1 DUF4397 domain-containing protein [Hymenobacter montanus]
MTTAFVLRRAFQAVLPATLLLAACGKDDKPADPVPVVDQGRIKVHHAAASANVPVKFLFDDVEKATLSYELNSSYSGYQAVNTGSRSIKVNVAASGTTATSQNVTVEKDRNYSYFAYANSGSGVAGLFIPDDLTPPASGKAKIRLVHLAQGTSNPLKLSSESIAGLIDVNNINVVVANYTPIPPATTPPAGSTVGASSFVEIPAGPYNIAITYGSPSVAVTHVGDGSGSGTGTKNYEAGKIYTVVFRGSSALLDPALQPKAVVISNN